MIMCTGADDIQCCDRHDSDICVRFFWSCTIIVLTGCRFPADGPTLAASTIFVILSYSTGISRYFLVLFLEYIMLKNSFFSVN